MTRIFAVLLGTTLAVAVPATAFAEHVPDGQRQYPTGQQDDWRRGDNDRGDWRRGDGRGDWRGRGCDNAAYGQIQAELRRLYNRVRKGQYDGFYSRDSARNFYRAIQLDQQYLDSYRNNDGCLDRREIADVRYRIDQLRMQMRQYDRRSGRGNGRWDHDDDRW